MYALDTANGTITAETLANMSPGTRVGGTSVHGESYEGLFLCGEVTTHNGEEAVRIEIMRASTTYPSETPVQIVVAPPRDVTNLGMVDGPLATAARALHRTRQQLRQMQTSLAQADERLHSLVADAHEYADNSDLCIEFDRFMEAHDLPARESDYEVEFEVTATITLRTTQSIARTGVENYEIDEDDAAEALAEALNTSDYAVDSVRTLSVLPD